MKCACSQSRCSVLFAFTLSFCFWAFSPLPLGAQQNSEAPSAHIAVPEISSERKELFINALLKDSVLSVSPDVPQEIADEKLKSVWAGNKPEIDASLADILLNFLKVDHVGREHQFSLSVRFEGDSLFVRHSQPASKHYIAGIRIGLKGNKPRKVLLQGYAVSGVVVAAPPMDDLGLRGALICPQDFFREDQVIKSPVLIDTKYRVKSVELKAGGHASGRVLTGSQVGYARASIATSERIPNSLTYFDVSYSKDPNVSVTYLADGDSQVMPVQTGARFLEGIQARLEMQTAAGYKKDLQLSESLLVEPFERDVNFPINFLKRSFVVSARNCVLLLQQREQRISYSKSELVLPPNIARK
jgi:hypothetical protein